MSRLLYDAALFSLLILFFPKLLIDFLFKKKYRKSLKLRLRPKAFGSIEKEVVWLHAVSVGETKALSTLVPHIKKSHPDAFLFITTVTETGQEEAERSIPDADAIHYLPLDFSWIIRSFVKALRPKLLVLVEGDYWLNLMREVKKCEGKIVVVNGKLSEKSLSRYLTFRPLSRMLFQGVDHYCLQGESYLERFLKLGIPPEKLTVTGNLKFDIPGKEKKPLDFLKLKEGARVITIGSTHEGEETLLLTALLPLLTENTSLHVLLVPRHPERFKKVKASIHHPQVTVVDRMGVLADCYGISEVAIVGGSFVKGIGGHDVFEPVKMGIPTLFGPHMYKQVDLDHLLTQSGAAYKVSLEEVSPLISRLLSDGAFRQEVSENGKQVAQKMGGASFRTWNIVQKNISLELKS